MVYNETVTSFYTILGGLLFRAIFMVYDKTTQTKGKFMYNPITRTKRFVKRHKTTLVYSAGLATGVVSTAYVFVKYPVPRHIIVPLDAAPEQIFELMKKSGGFDITNANTGQKIHVVTNQILESK